MGLIQGHQFLDIAESDSGNARIALRTPIKYYGSILMFCSLNRRAALTASLRIKVIAEKGIKTLI